MAVDASGLDADAYIDLTYANAYWSDRNNSTWSAAEDADKEAAIREATQFIDARFRERFVGYIQSTSQALEWPRTSAYDRSGRTLNGIPTPVKQACAELALEALSARLVPAEERGGMVKMEKVGPLTTEYMDTAPAGRTYRFAESLLGAVLKSKGKRMTRV